MTLRGHIVPHFHKIYSFSSSANLSLVICNFSASKSASLCFLLLAILKLINSKFQKSCIPLLNEFTSSTTVLCDFPSKLQLTSSHVKIFGINHLFQFLGASLSPLVQAIVILSQQFSILKKLLFSPQSLSNPFFYFTRVSSSFPLELKLIELICSLPNSSFNKILNIEFCSSFSVQLRTLKSSFQKNFNICLLQFLSSNSSPSITLPFPSFELFGIISSTDADVIFSDLPRIG